MAWRVFECPHHVGNRLRRRNQEFSHWAGIRAHESDPGVFQGWGEVTWWMLCVYIEKGKQAIERLL